jgi:RNA polymerase sigma factor (sigma-70 family)
MSVILPDFQVNKNELAEAWIRDCGKALDRYCIGLTKDHWEADDLVQETWLKVLQANVSRRKSIDFPKAYLFRIASNTWIDRYRKHQARPDFTLFEEGRTSAKENDFTTIYAELDEAFHRLIDHLPTKQLLVYIWVEAFSYSTADLAQMLKITEGSVKALLHRARNNMEKATVNEAKPSSVDEKAVALYLRAIQENDPFALAALWNDHSEKDNVPILRKLPDSKPKLAPPELGGMSLSRLSLAA